MVYPRFMLRIGKDESKQGSCYSSWTTMIPLNSIEMHLPQQYEIMNKYIICIHTTWNYSLKIHLLCVLTCFKHISSTYLRLMSWIILKYTQGLFKFWLWDTQILSEADSQHLLAILFIVPRRAGTEDEMRHSKSRSPCYIGSLYHLTLQAQISGATIWPSKKATFLTKIDLENPQLVKCKYIQVLPDIQRSIDRTHASPSLLD